MNESLPAAVVVPRFNEATVIGTVIDGLRQEFLTISRKLGRLAKHAVGP